MGRSRGLCWRTRDGDIRPHHHGKMKSPRGCLRGRRGKSRAILDVSVVESIGRFLARRMEEAPEQEGLRALQGEGRYVWPGRTLNASGMLSEDSTELLHQIGHKVITMPRHDKHTELEKEMDNGGWASGTDLLQTRSLKRFRLTKEDLEDLVIASNQGKARYDMYVENDDYGREVYILPSGPRTLGQSRSAA